MAGQDEHGARGRCTPRRWPAARSGRERAGDQGSRRLVRLRELLRGRAPHGVDQEVELVATGRYIRSLKIDGAPPADRRRAPGAAALVPPAVGPGRQLRRPGRPRRRVGPRPAAGRRGGGPAAGRAHAGGTGAGPAGAAAPGVLGGRPTSSPPARRPRCRTSSTRRGSLSCRRGAPGGPGGAGGGRACELSTTALGRRRTPRRFRAPGLALPVVPPGMVDGAARPRRRSRACFARGAAGVWRRGRGHVWARSRERRLFRGGRRVGAAGRLPGRSAPARRVVRRSNATNRCSSCIRGPAHARAGGHGGSSGAGRSRGAAGPPASPGAVRGAPGGEPARPGSLRERPAPRHPDPPCGRAGRSRAPG